MKQVQIENRSSINAITLQQDMKNATSSSVFENIEENISTDFDINVGTPKKERIKKKMRIKITLTN